MGRCLARHNPSAVASGKWPVLVIMAASLLCFGLPRPLERINAYALAAWLVVLAVTVIRLETRRDKSSPLPSSGRGLHRAGRLTRQRPSP